MNYVIIKNSNHYNTLANILKKDMSSKRKISNLRYYDSIRNKRMCSVLTKRTKFFEMTYFGLIKNNDKVKTKLRKEK